MNQNRRNFIKNSAFAVGSLALSGALFSRCSTPSKGAQHLVGIQLYSVREDMKADPLATLQKLSAMGYRHVEHAWYRDRKFYGWTPVEFKKVLSDLGMTMPSGHVGLGSAHWNEATNDFSDSWKQTIDDAAIVGQQFVISASLEESWYATEDAFKKSMEIFNKSGELCRQQGMMFGYHNHWVEFVTRYGDKLMHDKMLEWTDPALVMHQLDMGNLYNGGATALEVVKKWPGRFLSMHVKDEIDSNGGPEKYESTILGAGIVGVKAVVDAGKASGTIHFIVEQESYQGKTALDCMQKDFTIMQNWGY